MYGCVFNVKAQPDPCEEDKHVNGVLNYSETKEFVSNYLDFHSLSWDSYSRAYYINSKTFNFFADFLATNSTYTGLPFLFHNLSVETKFRTKE